MAWTTPIMGLKMTTTADLRPCNVSLVRRPLGRHGATIVCEKHVAWYVDRVQADYLAHPMSHSYPIRPGDTGAYNCRKTTSGSSWSKHAYGCAIDVNWNTNGYNASHHDIPMWLVQIFQRWGFGWGGFWNRVKDWMHFSKFPNEGGDGKLDAGSVPEPPQEEALVVTPEDEKKIRAIVQDVLDQEPSKFKEGSWAERVWKAMWRKGKDNKHHEELHENQQLLRAICKHFNIDPDTIVTP